MREKQRAVLGAIAIYLARTLANNGSPEIQPIKVSRPSAIVSDAQSNGIIRNRWPAGGSSAIYLFLAECSHLSTAAVRPVPSVGEFSACSRILSESASGEKVWAPTKRRNPGS